MIRRRVVVRGLVQGVFFRDTCRRQALAAGVSGWVRNNDDGSVEAVFEGSEDAVAAMCRWCRVGTPQSSVESVDEHAEKPRGDSGFRVTY